VTTHRCHLIHAHQLRPGDEVIIVAGDRLRVVESVMPCTYNGRPAIKVVTAGRSRSEIYLGTTHTVFLKVE
jgi:hypothetical protein